MSWIICWLSYKHEPMFILFWTPCMYVGTEGWEMLNFEISELYYCCISSETHLEFCNISGLYFLKTVQPWNMSEADGKI